MNRRLKASCPRVLLVVLLPVLFGPASPSVALDGYKASLVHSRAQVDWPVFHFDLSRTGNNLFENVINASNVGGLTEAWVAPMRDAPASSSPAIVGNSVYVGDFAGDLYAFDTGSGAQRWTARLGDTLVSSPAVSRGRVFVGTSLGDTVWALDAGSGSKLWKRTLSGSTFSSPAPRGGVV